MRVYLWIPAASKIQKVLNVKGNEDELFVVKFPAFFQMRTGSNANWFSFSCTSDKEDARFAGRNVYVVSYATYFKSKLGSIRAWARSIFKPTKEPTL